jgi:hypothetical protein
MGPNRRLIFESRWSRHAARFLALNCTSIKRTGFTCPELPNRRSASMSGATA